MTDRKKKIYRHGEMYHYVLQFSDVVIVGDLQVKLGYLCEPSDTNVQTLFCNYICKESDKLASLEGNVLFDDGKECS